MSRRLFPNRRTHTLRVIHPITGEIVHTFELFPEAWRPWDRLGSDGSKAIRASGVQLCSIRGSSDVAVLFVRQDAYPAFDPDLCLIVILRVTPSGYVRWERHYRAGVIHVDGLIDEPSYRTSNAYDHTGLAPLDSGNIAVLSSGNSVLALDGATGATLWEHDNPYSAFSVLEIPGTDTVRTSQAWIDFDASGIGGDFGHGEPKGFVRLEYTPPQAGSPGWLFSYYGSAHTKLCVAASGLVICSEQRPTVEYQTYWEWPDPANTVTGHFVARNGITLRQPSVVGWDWALSQSPDDDDGIVSQHMPAAENFTPFYNDFHASWFGIFGTYDPDNDPPFVAKSATISGDSLYVFCEPGVGSNHLRCYDFTGEVIGDVLWQFPCLGGNELASDETGCYVLGNVTINDVDCDFFKVSPDGVLLWAQRWRSLEGTSIYLDGSGPRSICRNGDFLYVVGDEAET